MPTIRRRTEPGREIEVSEKELLDFQRRGDVLATPKTGSAKRAPAENGTPQKEAQS